ncbi:hypothetical protein [Pseudomonas nitroreducens]|uniref:hypothetical protein n=1 Tax=Pseudomonas nitroreducens TaxID=46680 RepID=UPI0028AFBF19|nr:hypothetical protein [Pseudomonas nitroreducens]
MTPIDYRSTPQVDINRAEIAGLVAQFLSGGGVIEVLPGFTYQPLHGSRKEPSPIVAEFRRHGRRPMSIEQENALFEKLNRLTHMTMSAAMKQCHISHEVMRRMISKFDLKFADRVKPMGSPRHSEAEDAKLVEQVRAMAGQGFNKTKIRGLLSIGFERLNRIIEKYGIKIGEGHE